MLTNLEQQTLSLLKAAIKDYLSEDKRLFLSSLVIMNGIMANPSVRLYKIAEGNDTEGNWITEASVSLAKSLLKELDKQN